MEQIEIVWNLILRSIPGWCLGSVTIDNVFPAHASKIVLWSTSVIIFASVMRQSPKRDLIDPCRSTWMETSCKQNLHSCPKLTQNKLSTSIMYIWRLCQILLRETGPCASLGRTLRNHSPIEVFGWACFRVLFSCSPSVYRYWSTFSILLWIQDEIEEYVKFSTHVRVHVSPDEELHIVFPFPCVCFWQGGMDCGSTLDLKFAVSCAKLGRNSGWKTQSLAGLFTYAGF